MLTLPTPTDLYLFWGDEATDEDEDRAAAFIDLSANLLWLATSLEEDPKDSRLASLVKLAILDMAIYLMISREDIDANYSPFQSEHIGSYSYSKEYMRVSRSVAAGGGTGVPLFDKVVEYYSDLAFAQMGGWANSQNVFDPTYRTLQDDIWGRFWGYLQDPADWWHSRSYWYGGSADQDSYK